MRIKIEIDETELRKLVRTAIEEKINVGIDDSDVKIVVKTSQNFRAEWEAGQFKATYEADK